MVEEPHTQPNATTPDPSSTLTKTEPRPEWVGWLKENSIPISGVLLMLLAFCLVSHLRSGTGWSKARDIADTLAKVAQILAIIAGGWWTYFKFIKGRVYQESLIPEVSGKLLTIDSETYLIANVRLENVGQSLIEFAPDASTLRIFNYTSSTSSEIIPVKDNQLAQFVALDKLSIEPNEIIQRMVFMSVPVEVRLGLRLELLIISNYRRRYSWRTSFLVEKSSPNAIIDSGSHVRKETI
ncbi:MAG TPA: hypothetical protein VJ751_11890 [Pyrinomonadaceae bacterium]|nr:hypothetical protein [Pyrinomonadaceae bacterium]